MKNKTKFVNSLLLEASNSSEALASLNHWQKTLVERWSMQFVCKKIGIPSTGYFSDVLKGKRRLHPKYIAKTIKAFGLNDAQGRYFRLLTLLDQNPEGESRLELENEFKKARDHIGTEYLTVPEQLSSDLLFHMIVLSSLSLFSNKATKTQLESYFGRGLVIPLQRSLHRLEEIRLLKLHDGVYSINQTHVIFNESVDGFSHLEFLERSINHAKNQAKTWFSKKDEAIFLSTLITVNRDDYETKLPEIRAKIFAIMNELHSPTGDQLLEFHTQVFPFDPKLFKS